MAGIAARVGLALALLSLFAACAVCQLCTDAFITVDTTTFGQPIQQLVQMQTNATETNLLALLADGLLFYSPNAGRDWTDVTTRLLNYWKSNAIGQAAVSRLVPSPCTETGRTYVLGFAAYYWTVEASPVPGEIIIASYESSSPILDLIPSPTDDSMALMNAVPLGCDMDLSSSACRSVLYGSSNFGAQWVTVADYVHEYAWNDAGDGIFFLTSSSGSFYSADPDGNNAVQVIESGGVEFAYEDGVVFLVVEAEEEEGSDEIQFRYQLKVSEDDGKTFVEARFSSSTAANADVNTAGDFTLADVSFGTTFINVERTDIRWGSLYVARTQDASFYVTLQFNLLDNGVADFSPVILQAESGIFFANTYDVTPLSSLNDYSAIVQTMATFDKGGVWHRIPSPVNCTEECYLHLRGPADPMEPQILSTATAPGLVLAAGNVGLHRAPAQHDSVYFSRSAGYAWEGVLDGSHSYAIAAHGSLFLAAAHGQETGELLYSWTQGDSWDSCRTTDNLYDVDDIVEVGPATFLLVGRKYDGSATGVVQYLRFTDAALPRECVGPEAPDAEGSDFETWTAAVDGSCLLGKTSTYIRRKRDVACYISEEFEAYDYAAEHTCPCTREDYMCDGACWQKATDGSCEYACEDVEPTDEECSNGYRLESQGYMKIPGDVCEGGLDLGPVEVECEASPVYWQTAVAVWLTVSCFVMIAVIVFLIAVLMLMRSNEKLNALIFPLVPKWCTEDTGTLCCGGEAEDDEEDGFYAQLGGSRSSGSLVDDDDDYE